MFRLLFTTLLVLAMTEAAMPQSAPNLDTQRAAMKKLSFLVGTWSGEARILRAEGTLEMSQREEARFKLGGLVLEIEGTGTKKSDGAPALQALGLISFDDASGKYHFRAFNDGRWLESDVTLTGDNQLSWGFAVGPYQTRSVLRMNDKGEWTEAHELLHGSDPPRKLMEVTVRRTQ